MPAEHDTINHFAKKFEFGAEIRTLLRERLYHISMLFCNKIRVAEVDNAGGRIQKMLEWM